MSLVYMTITSALVNPSLHIIAWINDISMLPRATIVSYSQTSQVKVNTSFKLHNLACTSTYITSS
uniref:Uncharacterized protein n=1 Tax=Setaria italica TaxID=4555 RepID=K3ZYU7_SETIT